MDKIQQYKINLCMFGGRKLISILISPQDKKIA